MKKLEDYEWICPEAFTNAHVAINGVMRPCCTMSREPEMEKYLEQYEIKNVKDTSFKEYYNSPLPKRLRDAMRNNDDKDFVNAFCKRCVNSERVGNQSMREWSISRFNHEMSHKKEELERIIAEDIEPTFFHTFEAKPFSTNVCNLSCSMCFSDASSRYLAESIKLKEVPKQPVHIKSPMCDEFMKELPDILDKAEEIKVIGGEPLLSKGTYQLLDTIKDKSTKRFKTVTNGTIDPTRIIGYIKQFKEATCNISIDGIPEVTEYIRWPSKWETVKETHSKLIQYADVYFIATINCLNIGTVPEFYDFMNENEYKFTSVNIVTNNNYSLRSVPPDIKNLYLNKLYKHKMKTHIKYLEDAKYNEDEMWQMLAHVKRRDKLRGTNLLDVLPEWKPYYDKVIV